MRNTCNMETRYLSIFEAQSSLRQVFLKNDTTDIEEFDQK